MESTFMRLGIRAIMGMSIVLMGIGLAGRVQASYITVEAFSLTLPGYAFGTNLSLPQMNRTQGMTLMPFYLHVNFSGHENTNWGVELFSSNINRLTGSQTTTSDGLYRGLRGFLNPSESVPLYWQTYPSDLNVPASYGTPNSVTNVAGGLAFSLSTLRYWGTVYDSSDVDRVNTWEVERPDRIVASIEGLGKYPSTGRLLQGADAYLYFAADLRNVNVSQDYVGQLNVRFYQYAFDFNKGCYVTPNPVKPVLGQRAYFNFYTNSPDSRIKIKIYDPTGYPIATLDNTRYWDCRNSNGHLVEGGLYLYQIDVEGHFISGTMVVIK